MVRKIRCRLCLGLLLLLVLGSPLGAQGEGGDFRKAAKQRLAELDAPDAPGLAYAVVSRGEVTEFGARGVKRLGSDAPITPETPFLIGSISKSFTALAVMQLVESGELSLDDPIARYLPAFAEKSSGAITIRRLLSHTSGFSTYQGHLSGETSSHENDPIARRAIQLARMGPAHEPGAAWEYSNANYLLLGRLIEVISGQSFPDYVEAHVLKPIGMQDSFVSDGKSHAAMASGHRPWFGTKRPLAENRTDLGTAPQGGIVASARDMARYMIVMMNGKSDVVSARTKSLMMAPASDASPFYGFGWSLNPEEGTVWHSGASPGFSTLLTMKPKEGTGVVVLVNATSGIGFGDMTPLLTGITNGALGLEYEGKPGLWGQKATFASLVLLPFVFLSCIVWAWRHRAGLRAKSGPFGRFSLWFPLLTTLGASWFLLFLIPRLFGLPLNTMRPYLPDLSLAMIASAIIGVLWALVRLGLAYTGRSART